MINVLFLLLRVVIFIALVLVMSFAWCKILHLVFKDEEEGYSLQWSVKAAIIIGSTIIISCFIYLVDYV